MRTYKIGNKEIYADVSPDADIAIRNTVREAVKLNSNNAQVKFEDDVYNGRVKLDHFLGQPKV